MPKIENSGDCGGCGLHGLVIRCGTVILCPVCLIDCQEVFLDAASKRVSHTALLVGQQFLRGGLTMKDALRRQRDMTTTALDNM